MKRIVHINFAFLFVLTTFLSSGFMLILQNEQAGAIAVRGTSTGFVANADNNYSVTTPTGTVSGDLLILFQHHGSGNLDIESDWGQSGSDWTFERAEALDPGTSNESASVWYKTAVAGDAGGSGSYTFNANISDALRWVIVAVEDHNGFDVSEGYHDADVTTSPSVSDSITPTQDGALLLAFLAKDDNDGQTTASWTSGQSLTNEESHNNEGSVLYTSVFSETLSGTGSVTRDFNLTGTNIDGTAKQIMVTVNPAAVVSTTNVVPVLTQEGYIFENDDGANADSNSQQAAGNTSIEGVRKGEKVNLRMQLSNSDVALDSELGLFYQKDDGFWTQVRHGTSNSPIGSLNSGLAGHWKLDGDTTDSTPFGNDGTINGVVTSTTDRFGNPDSAYSFNGGFGSYITTTNQTQYDRFTISAWVYNTDGTTGDARTIVSNSRDCGAPGCGTTNRGFDLSGTYFLDDPKFNIFDSSNGVSYGTENDLPGVGTPVNEWVNFVGTYDGSTIKLYRNGVLYDSVAFSQSSMGTPSAPIRIGNLGVRTDYPWLGSIDDVRYYNRALSSNEVNALYNYSDCTDTDFVCDTIDDNMDVFKHINSAINPSTDLPWAVYETTGFDLAVARYAGNGGTGCNGANTKWSCEIIDTNAGKHPSIAFTSGGKAWVSFVGSGSDLYVAEYVGTGGTGCAGANPAWTCTELLEGTFDSTDIAIDENGKVWITAVNSVAGDLYVVERVGTGGSGCFSGTVFRCVTVDNDVGTTTKEVSTTSIVIDDTNTPNIMYEDESGSATLIHAKFVGASGTGCTSAAWTCVTVAVSSGSTSYLDAAISPQGDIWTSYHLTSSGGDLAVARYVGTGGNCDTALSGSDAWECTSIDTTGATTGQATSIQFDPGGQAFISYHDLNIGAVAYARYVGTGGAGCASSAWAGCAAIQDDANDNGEYTSVSIDGSGTIWVFYTTETANDLNVAVTKSNYEISPATSSTISTEDSLTESHVDMTTVTDSVNRDDADCLASGASWNNGVFSYNGLTNHPLPDGSTTVQCTEITFGLSTANAFDGTFRFALAYKDLAKNSQSFWRGVAQIDEYPTMTVQDEPGVRFSKGVTPIFPDCTGGNGEWGCETIAENGTSLGRYPAVVVDNDGVAWIGALSDLSDGHMIVANYVGSGGNCDTIWTDGSDRFDCEIIYDEASDDDGLNVSAAINPVTNKPSFTFTATQALDRSKIVIADYVGSGGTGCIGGSTAWNCTVIMDPGWFGFGEGTSIQFSLSGVPYVAIIESSGRDIWFASYVGEGGNCDDDYSGSDAWNCEEIVTTGQVGRNVRLVIDRDGIPWIAASRDDANDDLYIIEYVGSGGVNCGNPAWECTAVIENVQVSPATETDTTITVDKYNSIWATYSDISTADVRLGVAQYVGVGGTGCDDSAWTCTIVDSVASDDIGDRPAIGIDKTGNPIITYANSGVAGTFNDIRYARYVGSGGSGCTSSAWDGCETIYAKNGAGRDINLTIDNNGLAWVVHRDETADNLHLIKQHAPKDILYNFNHNISQNTGVANSADLIYAVTDGRSPRSLDNEGCGSGLANLLGYCGMLENDGSFDSITAGANERPYVTAAVGFNANTEMPLVNWIGRTDVSPNTAGTAGDLQLEIYRHGTTNGWETLASDTVSSNCNTVDCSLSGAASGPPVEYFRLEDGVYWFNIRIYQLEASSSMTLKTDELGATITAQRLRTGRSFEGGASRPFVTE